MKLRLHGRLADWGQEFDLCARSPRAAMKILAANFPDLGTWLMKAEGIGIGFAVMCDGERISPEALDTGAQTVDVYPLPVASSGAARIVTGAALIGLSFFVPGAGLFGVSSLSATNVGLLGATILLGGIGQLLAPGQNPQDDLSQENFNVSGNVQTSRQGQAYPVLLGRRQIDNLTVISGSIVSVDYVEEEEL